MSSSNLLQSAFQALFDGPVTPQQRQEAAYQEFERLCEGTPASNVRSAENPARLVSIYELGERHHRIERTNPYFIAAQILNVKHPAEGKEQKELSTEKANRLKSGLGKRDAPGGSRVSGSSKEIIKYNRMVVFRYYLTIISIAGNYVDCPLCV